MIFLCASVICSLLLLQALVTGHLCVCVSVCVRHTSQIFCLSLAEFEEALYFSVQCGRMLQCFKWRIVLCNLRNPAKSAFFEINSRDSCSDLAGLRRNTLFDQITKQEVLTVPLLSGCNIFLEERKKK